MKIEGATAQLVDPWWTALSYYRTAKAARCEPSAVKVTEWYCVPVVRAAIQARVALPAYRPKRWRVGNH